MIGIAPLTAYHRMTEPYPYDSTGYPITVIADIDVTDIDRPTGI